jgi:hypothetical protein
LVPRIRTTTLEERCKPDKVDEPKRAIFTGFCETFKRSISIAETKVNQRRIKRSDVLSLRLFLQICQRLLGSTGLAASSARTTKQARNDGHRAREPLRIFKLRDSFYIPCCS